MSDDNQNLGLKIPQPGDVLSNKYRIEGVMARGGYGIVYDAHQLGVERPAVVKILPPSAGHDEEAFMRFQREARVASSLNHPNTVTIFDFGISEGGLMYIAMEKLSGLPLNQVLLNDHALEPERVRKILTQIMEALMAAHASGIIHRDLKPANVLLCDIHGKKDWVKIIDFGIAKVLEAVDESLVQTLTQDGLTVGTPGYIAPELLAGGDASAQADIYAVGVIAYELLTGHLAFDGTTPFEKIRKQMQEEPIPPPEPIKASPLWPIVEKMMSRKPEDRHTSSKEAFDALEALPKLDAPLPPSKPRVAPRSTVSDAPTAPQVGVGKPSVPGKPSAAGTPQDAPTQAMPINAPAHAAHSGRQGNRPAQRPIRAQKPKSKTGLIVGLSIGIFLLIVLAVVGALVMSSGGKDAVGKKPAPSKSAE